MPLNQSLIHKMGLSGEQLVYRERSFDASDMDYSNSKEDLEEAECLEEDGVRIYPAKMKFVDAFDGKSFEQKIRIINAGKYAAFVRVLPPTSKAFKIKPLPKGQYLSSGISITRTIRYTYSSAFAIPSASLFIYVNEKPIRFNLEVYLSVARVYLKPKYLYFGEIDVGIASEPKIVYLKNEGHKSASFLVDSGKHEFELLVEPLRGIIQPYSEVALSVEILGSKEGNFIREFWIKTETPLRVRLTAAFVFPKLIVEYPLTMYNLTLINFPKTYFGAESKKSLVIKNRSAQPTMFCTLCEVTRKILTCEEAREVDYNFRCFRMQPKEGRLMASHRYVLNACYAPKNIKGYFQNYSLAFFRVQKISYRDGVVAEKEMEVKTFSGKMDKDAYTVLPTHSSHDKLIDYKALQEKSLRVCLYGEAEEASVLITPDSFSLTDLILNKNYKYTVNIQNKSHYLPITFVYNKVACIEVEPKKMCLNPDQNVDILINVRPSQVGNITAVIILNLEYQTKKSTFPVGTAKLDVFLEVKMLKGIKSVVATQPKFVPGITPMLTHEVGFLVDDIRFNTSIEIPRQAAVDLHYKSFNKTNTALIAFPNDRSKCLRPGRHSVPCKTIFAQIPRYTNKTDEYMLNEAEIERRTGVKNYFENFIRPDVHPDLKVSNDYSVSNSDALLMEPQMLSVSCPQFNLEDNGKQDTPCIALPPEKLLNILITPKYISLGKIAAYSSTTDSFAIENKNNFRVEIQIKALSNSVVIKARRTIYIQPNTVRKIHFDCFSYGLGKYYVPVYIIVNECHIFDAIVFAEVVPCIVKCTAEEFVLTCASCNKFVTIRNPVNIPIEFNWEVQDDCYDVTPPTGIIPPRRNLTCKITYNPTPSAVFSTEIYLKSETGAKQIFRTTYKNEKAKMKFHTDAIIFKNIPLNKLVTQNLIVRNYSEETFFLVVTDSMPISGIEVTPSQALLGPKCDYFFRVTALFQVSCTFSCPLIFVQQNAYNHKIEISGNVVCPEIEIKPSSIQFTKIPAGAIQRRLFCVTNTALCDVDIEFPMKRYKEFTVVDVETFLPCDKMTLQPKESFNLYLQFTPEEPIVYSLVIPYVLNQILGPPIFNNEASRKVEKYFVEIDKTINQTRGTWTVIKVEKPLATVKVRCAAGLRWLEFSSSQINFIYNGETCRNDFVIKNITNKAQGVILKADSISKPFSVKMESCDCENSMYCCLVHPQRNVTFIITFEPEEYGQYDILVPIIVVAHSDACPFNYLKIIGRYPEPTIKPSMPYVFFPTVPVYNKTVKILTLQYSNHKPDCVNTFESELEEFQVQTQPKRTTKCSDYQQKVCISFSSKAQGYFSTDIKFCCTCGASATVEVKAFVDNCLIAWFANLVGPVEPTISLLEQWLFNQVFFGKEYYKIPHTIAKYPFVYYTKFGMEDNKEKKKKTEVIDKKKNKKQQEIYLPITQLLINLLDKAVMKHFFPGDTPVFETATDETLFYYTIYKNILLFLNSHSICSLIRPEHLLPYDMYLVFKDRLIDEDFVTVEETYTEKQFHVFSKEAWTDLLLKIYKAFVFDRLAPHSLFEEEIQKHVNEHAGDFPDDCISNEVTLLLWVDYHYQKEKDNIVPSTLGPEKEIRNYLQMFEDCLPLITLIISYCPYTRSLFQEIYFDVAEKKAKRFNNLCTIVNVWKQLNFSFNLRSDYSFDYSDLEILMLLTYLYDMLPDCYPSETITIKSNVGEKATSNLLLRNPSHVQIAYTVVLFGNDMQEFQVEKNVLTIAPLSQTICKITYIAKTIVKSSAVMVLSGDTKGYKYAKSKTYNLIGIPDIFYHINEFAFQVPLYTPYSQTIEITSPYGKDYFAHTFLINYSNLGEDSKPPETIEDFLSMATLKAERTPRQINFNELNQFDETGVCKFHLELCLVTSSNKKYLVYFLNEDVGVFCVQIIAQSVLSKDMTVDIAVKVPPNFDCKGKCRCRNGVVNAVCPLVIQVPIPCRNDNIMEGFKRMFEAFAEENEAAFWRKHLVFPIGFCLFRLYMENTYDPNVWDFQEVLNPSVTYTATAQGKNFIPVKTFQISDVTSPCHNILLIHWNTCNAPDEEHLTLMATNGEEIRKYRLIFKAKYAYSSSMNIIPNKP